MAQQLRFDDETEDLVGLIEQTKPDEIIAETYTRLSKGESKERLLAAAALAVSRSTVLPASHHGGPVHPVSGIYSVEALSKRNVGEKGFFPVIQSVALANKHIHSPSMGPNILVQFDIAEFREMDDESLLAGFQAALEQRMSTLAEKYLVLLLRRVPAGTIMDSLLKIAIPRNALDDHYFLYTVFAFRALEIIGWQYAEAILRPPVRFLCRHPKLEHAGGERGKIIEDGISLYKRFEDFEQLIVEKGLDVAEIKVQTCEDETVAVDQLASEVDSISNIADIVQPVIAQLAGGLSMMGVLEGLSLGGARRYLRSNTGNPFDVHLHTGINARRYLLSVEGLSQKARLLALLSWGQGYEIRHLDRTLQWDPTRVSLLTALPEGSSEQEAIDSIAKHLECQQQFDLNTLEGSIAELRAPESVLHITKMADDYLKRGHDPEALFKFLAFDVCKDDQSEMHAYKMQQAAYEEYTHSRKRFRDAHLLAAVKHAATVARLGPRTVYPEVCSFLEGLNS